MDFLPDFIEKVPNGKKRHEKLKEINRNNEIEKLHAQMSNLTANVGGGCAGLILSSLIDPVTAAVSAPFIVEFLKDNFGTSSKGNLESVIYALAERIEALEEQGQIKFVEQISTPKGAGFQSEVHLQAFRAFTDERRQRIVNLALYGLTGTDESLAKADHFLRIQGQLGDEDISLLLKQYLLELEEDSPDPLSNAFNTNLEHSRGALLASFGLLSSSTGELGSVFGRLTEIGKDFLTISGLQKGA